jgi:hypothetical protein
MQRIFMVLTVKILQIERNTKETKVYFYFRDAAYLHVSNLKGSIKKRTYKVIAALLANFTLDFSSIRNNCLSLP